MRRGGAYYGSSTVGTSLANTYVHIPRAVILAEDGG